jgi:type II secretory pathway predicted ATPase ExeA
MLFPSMIAPRRHPSSRPFLAAPRVDFYHPARGIDAALHGLDRLVRRSEGVGLVVGPPGTGKSLLLAKVAESVGDDFAVALLSGARICTRRALWQSILAAIGEPYRGIEEGELRIGVVERIRGLAATGAGLVVLVDEGHTLPTRLIEELRQLTNIPTPMPAVHIVLAGTAELEEILGSPKMESFTQRIGARHYLEPLDHAETVAYVRTQMKAAGLDWESRFEPGCDDAVFSATDGVPRLINQLCDHALVMNPDAGPARVAPAAIVAAWSEIQRLPPPAALAAGAMERDAQAGVVAHGIETTDDLGGPCAIEAVDAFGGDIGVVEFGSFSDDTGPEADAVASTMGRHLGDAEAGGRAAHGDVAAPAEDPWQGPEVELVFEPAADPFEEYFEQEERVMERYVMRGPEDFSGHRHVASREGAAIARQLDVLGQAVGQASACHSPSASCPPRPSSTPSAPAVAVVAPADDIDDGDDGDMVVIEEDILEHPSELRGKSIFAVRPGDYRSLFARLRRGDK